MDNQEKVWIKKISIKELFIIVEDIIIRNGSQEDMLNKLKKTRKKYYEAYDIK